MRWPPPTWLAILVAVLAAGAALVGLVASLTDLPRGRHAAGAGGPVTGTARAAPTSPGRPVPGPGPGTAGVPEDAGAAEEHLALARRLLDSNGADAPGASKEGLLRAEVEVQASLRLGPIDPASALRLLADVNGALASGWGAAGEEKQGYQRREREALRGLLEWAPDDGQARWRYAMLIEDQGLRIEELIRAARLAPGDYRPRRALGEEWLAAGREDEGARLLVEAAELCTPEELGHQGPDIAHMLRLHGREEEEARVRQRLERLGY